MAVSQKPSGGIEKRLKNLKPFKKGHKGIGGRPKGVVTIGQYYRDWLDAEQNLVAVTERLLKLSPAVILHYAYGKPLETTATVDATGNLDTLIDRLTQLKRERMKQGDTNPAPPIKQTPPAST